MAWRNKAAKRGRDVEAFLTYSERPRINADNTGQYALLLPFAPPPASVFGNGGTMVLRDFEAFEGATYIQGQQLTEAGLTNGSAYVQGSTALEPLYQTGGNNTGSL